MPTLKTAWLNLQDSLGKRFAWSHVKAIFYNYAEEKLLSTKLDEMDTAIDAKINKTDIVQTESTATDKVPSSAYLKEVKDALAEDISELNAEIITNPKGENKQEVISGSSIASDKVLLQYTIQTTNILYSGAKIYINNILFLEISSQSENLPCKFIGVLYAFKGDVIRYDANPQGGSVSVNAYIP